MSAFIIILKKKKFLFIKPLSPLQFKKIIENLGPSFIKLAQVLATRADLFPQKYLQKLKELHDEIEPMVLSDFQKVYNKAFGKKPPFVSFESKPIASASIGQVHSAYLKNHIKVAVKLRRYGIVDQVKTDIAILKIVSNILKPFFSTYTKNSIESVIDEFSKMILIEIDFKKELGNIKEFSKIYSKSNIIFPKTYDKYCSESALVMSFEQGVRFNDKNALIKQNIDFNEIMKNLVIFYTDQMLLKGFFHADPHPGNLLINSKGEIILLDFGMVKRISNQTRIAMIELARAANEYNFENFIKACRKMGIIAYEAPQYQMQEYAEKMFEIFGNEFLSSSSMQTLIFEVLESMQDFPFKLPQDVIYVMRASSIIEGLGTTYIENFNGVKDIIPILRAYIPKALLSEEKLFDKLINELNNFPFLLKRLKDIVYNISDGSMTMNISRDQVEWVEKEVRSYLKNIFIGFIIMFIGMTLLISSLPIKILGWPVIISGLIKVIYSL